MSELEARICEIDLAGVHRWLRTADDADLRAARAWYVKGRWETQRQYSWTRERLEKLPAEAWFDARWIRTMLAVALAAPVSAAGWVPWRELYDHPKVGNPDVMVELASARGAAWCRDFVDRAAAVRMGQRELQVNSGLLFHVLSGLIDAHDLPVPSGASFAVGWAHRYDTYPPAGEPPGLRDDPLLPDVFHHLLASGFAVKLQDAAGRGLGLVRAGRLDRDRLVAQCVELLTAPQRVSTQRIIATVLAGLEVRPDELGGPALLLNLIATCDGRVGSLLLPFAIDSVTDQDELVELCATIAGRTERKQQKDLIAALRSHLAVRLGTAAPVAGLGTFRAAAVDDPQLLSLVDRALSRLGTASVPSEPVHTATGLWPLDPPGEPYVARRTALVDDRAVVDRAYADAARHGPRRPLANHVDAGVTLELLLGDLVRRAHSDGAAAVRGWLAALPWTASARHDPMLEGIHDGYTEPPFEPYATSVDRGGVLVFDVRTRDHTPPRALAHWPTAFRYLLARESMLRLGRTPCLLSTPTRDDASIDFDDLVARIRQAQSGQGFGPLDLLQALLRLRTPEPHRADELAGLHLGVDRAVELPNRAPTVTDAVAATQQWIRAGGVPALTAEPTPHGLALRTSDLPIAPASFGTLPAEAYRPGYDDPFVDAVVVPAWWELAVDDFAPGRRGPGYTHNERSPGPLTYRWLLRRMSSDRPDRRDEGARTALQLMGERRFDPAAFAASFADAVAAKELRVARVVAVWNLVATGGGLRRLWSAAVTITARAVAERPLPTGAHELLAWLTRYVAEVPEPELPTEIVAFARGRGTTKAHHEARALLDAARTLAPARPATTTGPSRRASPATGLWQLDPPNEPYVPPGPLTYRWLLSGMSSDRPERREEAGRTALHLMYVKQFDPAAFAATFADAVVAKEIRVARVVAVWDLAATGGGLRRLWPAALMITARAVAERPLPTGTHELLAWLTRYVAEVPEPELPTEIAAFACRRGTTKAHHEARALLDAARRVIPA